jgi:hypothetical protein
VSALVLLPVSVVVADCVRVVVVDFGRVPPPQAVASKNVEVVAVVATGRKRFVMLQTGMCKRGPTSEPLA